MRATNPNLRNTPPRWAACDEALNKFIPVDQIGFKGKPGDLRRFASRYRLAKSFQEVVLNSYTPETSKGYSSLFKVFLTWSAFEQFMEICGLKMDSILKVIPPEKFEAFKQAALGAQGSMPFYEFLIENLNEGKSHWKHMKKFTKGEECNPLYLPASIRHIFAHGILTPHSGTGTPEVSTTLSSLICDFLFQVMDQQIESRILV